jgi:hypothetical protein
MMQSTNMIGANTVNGILKTQMNTGINAMLITRAKKLAEYRLAIRPQTKS